MERGGFTGMFAEQARPLLETLSMLQHFERLSPDEQRQYVDAITDETQRKQLSDLTDSGASELIKQ